MMILGGFGRIDASCSIFTAEAGNSLPFGPVGAKLQFHDIWSAVSMFCNRCPLICNGLHVTQSWLEAESHDPPSRRRRRWISNGAACVCSSIELPAHLVSRETRTMCT